MIGAAGLDSRRICAAPAAAPIRARRSSLSHLKETQ